MTETTFSPTQAEIVPKRNSETNPQKSQEVALKLTPHQSVEAQNFIKKLIKRQEAAHVMAKIKAEFDNVKKDFGAVVKTNKRRLATAAFVATLRMQDAGDSINSVISPDTGNTEQQYAQVVQERKVQDSEDISKLVQDTRLGYGGKPHDKIEQSTTKQIHETA
jgi:hypothetical protein